MQWLLYVQFDCQGQQMMLRIVVILHLDFTHPFKVHAKSVLLLYVQTADCSMQHICWTDVMFYKMQHSKHC